MHEHDFWTVLEQLVSSAELVIDRPKGSVHPRYPEFAYPYDYGYLMGTSASDGDGIDVWVGSLPGRVVTGIVCTIDLVKRDSEIKVLLSCTRKEAEEITRVHNGGAQAATLIFRE